jgi:hypothetical protein
MPIVRRIKTLDPKDTDEADVIAFDFTASLSGGESVVSATVACETFQGVDAAPAALLSGTPQILSPVVTHKVQGGLDGVTYALRCAATTSSARVLVAAGLLPVVRLPQ